MKNVFIQRLGAFLPGQPIDNESMEQVLGQINGKPSRVRRVILRSNGIQSRYYARDKAGNVTFTTAQLAAMAVRNLCCDWFQLEHIDLLTAGTSGPDQIQPGHANMVMGELGHGPFEAVTFGGVCNCGIAALKYAYMAVGAGLSKHAVATAAEAASSFMNRDMFERETKVSESELQKQPELAFDADFLRWMLSDGAGAMLVGAKPAPKGLSLRIDWIEMTSYSHAQPACMYAGAEKMPDGRLRGWRDMPAAVAAKNGVFNYHQDVRQLNENIVELTVDKPFPKVLEAHPMKPGEIDWFLPHMSSEYFRKHTVEAFERAGFRIPAERWFTNLNRVGNVGSASIYLMLEELMRRDDVRVGQRILCLIPESARFSTAYMHLTVVEPE